MESVTTRPLDASEIEQKERHDRRLAAVKEAAAVAMPLTFWKVFWAVFLANTLAAIIGAIVYSAVAHP